MPPALQRTIALVDEITPRMRWLPLAVARLTLGWVFLQSGWGKLHNLEGVTEFFVSLGIPAAHLQAPLVAGIEFAGGALLLIGLATRLAAAPLIGVMGVAIATALWSGVGSPSDLFALAEFGYIVLLLGLVVFGAGALSADALIRRQLARRA